MCPSPVTPQLSLKFCQKGCYWIATNVYAVKIIVIFTLFFDVKNNNKKIPAYHCLTPGPMLMPSHTCLSTYNLVYERPRVNLRATMTFTFSITAVISKKKNFR